MSLQATKLKPISVGGLSWLMMLLAIGGIGISAYLTWGYTAPGATLACGGSHGCEVVKNSIYANFWGIPLPLIGLAFFVTVLVLLIFQQQFVAGRRAWSPYIALAIFGISLAGVLYSAYLTYLELFVIYAICRWCITLAIITTTIMFLSIFNLRHNNQLS
jgi:uncharacterized membrane protein